MHAALVPEHLREMPPLGWSFIAAAVIGAGIASVIVSRPGGPPVGEDRGPFLAGEVVAWVVFVSIRVPGFMGTPEPIETIALVCKAVELAGLALVIPLGWGDQIAARTASAKGLMEGSRPASRAAETRRSDLPTL